MLAATPSCFGELRAPQLSQLALVSDDLAEGRPRRRIDGEGHLAHRRDFFDADAEEGRDRLVVLLSG